MSLVGKILGEGAVADLCVWKDKKRSGITLVMATVLWFVLEIMETPFVPLLCEMLLFPMVILFLWAKFGELFFTRRPPTPEEIKLPIRALSSKMEGFLLTLYDIAYWKDIKTFLWTYFYVTIFYIAGSYLSLLNILYICFVFSMTIPCLYLKFQEVIDIFLENVTQEKNKLVQIIKDKVFNKIPSGTKVD